MLVMSKALPAASVLVASKPGRAPRRPGRLRVRAQGDAQQDPTSPLILPSRRELEIIGRGAPTGKLGGSDDIFRLPPGLRGLSPDDLPTQGRSVVEGNRGTAVQEREPGFTDVDYLSELMAIQESGPRDIGFFGTRNMGYSHQSLIEILSYAMVLTNNHVFTSGATGTNAAVIRGALRAEKPDLLTVILPQSLSKQPPESQELLQKVQKVIEMPENDKLPLLEASRLCNADILKRVQQVICFAFHDSRVLLETCAEAKSMRKIVTLFYLD